MNAARPGRLAVVVVVVALTLMWIYALSGAARRDPKDRLDDRVFTARAEDICAATIDRLKDLPAVSHESPAAELAATVDDITVLFSAMVADLRAAAPSQGQDGRIAGAWLDDWDTHVGDLREWADELHSTGQYLPFGETPRGGEPLTEAMDTLARVNDMPSCETP
ncbi:MAG: hypothetical protein ACRD0U_17115 [Acidimicrobiales bacterium]